MDGAYAEGYGTSLGRAFVLYPETYVRILADRDFTDEERRIIIGSTALDAGSDPEACQAAIKTLESLTEDISEEERRKCEEQGATGYWMPTRINAIKPLHQLLALAQMRPDGVWDGD